MIWRGGLFDHDLALVSRSRIGVQQFVDAQRQRMTDAGREPGLLQLQVGVREVDRIGSGPLDLAGRGLVMRARTVHACSLFRSSPFTTKSACAAAASAVSDADVLDLRQPIGEAAADITPPSGRRADRCSRPRAASPRRWRVRAQRSGRGATSKRRWRCAEDGKAATAAQRAAATPAECRAGVWRVRRWFRRRHGVGSTGAGWPWRVLPARPGPRCQSPRPSNR